MQPSHANPSLQHGIHPAGIIRTLLQQVPKTLRMIDSIQKCLMQKLPAFQRPDAVHETQRVDHGIGRAKNIKLPLIKRSGICFHHALSILSSMVLRATLPFPRKEVKHSLCDRQGFTFGQIVFLFFASGDRGGMIPPDRPHLCKRQTPCVPEYEGLTCHVGPFCP